MDTRIGALIQLFSFLYSPEGNRYPKNTGSYDPLYCIHDINRGEKWEGHVSTALPESKVWVPFDRRYDCQKAHVGHELSCLWYLYMILTVTGSYSIKLINPWDQAKKGFISSLLLIATIAFWMDATVVWQSQMFDFRLAPQYGTWTWHNKAYSPSIASPSCMFLVV